MLSKSCKLKANVYTLATALLFNSLLFNFIFKVFKICSIINSVKLRMLTKQSRFSAFPLKKKIQGVHKSRPITLMQQPISGELQLLLSQ